MFRNLLHQNNIKMTILCEHICTFPPKPCRYWLKVDGGGGEGRWLYNGNRPLMKLKTCHSAHDYRVCGDHAGRYGSGWAQHGEWTQHGEWAQSEGQPGRPAEQAGARPPLHLHLTQNEREIRGSLHMVCCTHSTGSIPGISFVA